MNLLTYHARFNETETSPTTIYEAMGYLKAMQDFLRLLEHLTHFHPSKRMVDAAALTETIAETSAAVEEYRKRAEAQLLYREGTTTDDLNQIEFNSPIN